MARRPSFDFGALARWVDNEVRMLAPGPLYSRAQVRLAAAENEVTGLDNQAQEIRDEIARTDKAIAELQRLRDTQSANLRDVEIDRASYLAQILALQQNGVRLP